jgi:hypothetical protein
MFKCNKNMWEVERWIDDLMFSLVHQCGSAPIFNRLNDYKLCLFSMGGVCHK